MIFSIDDELLLLKQENLTPNELFLIKILIGAQDCSKGTREFDKYYNTSNEIRAAIKATFESLKAKGIIHKSYTYPENISEFNVLDVPFNKNFSKRYGKDSTILGNELQGVYPTFTCVNGQYFIINSISKKFNSPEDAWYAYGKAIHWDVETHHEIINLIQENPDFSYPRLDSFIIDKLWEKMFILKDQGLLGNDNFITVL